MCVRNIEKLTSPLLIVLIALRLVSCTSAHARSHEAIRSTRGIGAAVVLIRGGADAGLEELRVTGDANSEQDLYLQLMIKSLKAASTLEQLVSVTDQFKTMRNVVDINLRIRDAEFNDAVIASHTIHRMGSIAARANDTEATALLESRRFEQLIEIIEIHIRELSTLDLCRVVWGLSILGSDMLDFIPKIALELEERLKILTPVESATVIWVLACARETMGIEHPSLAEAACHQLVTEVSTLPLKTTVKCLWAAGVLNLFIDDFIKPALSLMSIHTSSLSSPDAASIIWTSARLNLALDSAFFTKLATQVLNSTDALSDSELVGLSWALAYMDNNPDDQSLDYSEVCEEGLPASSPRELLKVVVDHVHKRLHLLLPRDIAQIFWAISSTSLSGPEGFLEALRAQLMCSIEHMTLSQLASVCNSIGTCVRSLTLSLSSPEWYTLVGKLTTLADRSVDAFSRSDIIDVVWGIASMGLPLDRIAPGLRRRLQFTLHELEPKALCQLLEACVQIPPRMRVFTEQLAASVRQRVADMNTLDRVYAFIALARLGLVDTRSVAQQTHDLLMTADMLAPRLVDADVQQLANKVFVALLWACGKSHADALMEVLLTDLPHRMGVLSQGELCICLCALSDVCVREVPQITDRARPISEMCAEELVRRPDALPPVVLAGTVRACRSLRLFDVAVKSWAQTHTQALAGLENLGHYKTTGVHNSSQEKDPAGSMLHGLPLALINNVETGGGVFEGVTAPNSMQRAAYWKGRCDEELRLYQDAAVGGSDSKAFKKRYDLGKRLLSKLFLHLG